jgi:dihydroneopterin triphosphate diphosphatase
MPEIIARVVDVYAYRNTVRARREFLLLRRASSVSYAGHWRMLAGKIRPSEKAWQTAEREIREETGLLPVCLWAVPSANVFYEWQSDRVNVIPAFAAELDADPRLNHEHDAFGWFSAAEAAGHLVWPEQRRLLLMVDRMADHALPPELVVPVSPDPEPSRSVGRGGGA